MTWTLLIRDVPPSGNVIKRMHWAKYRLLMEAWYYRVRANFTLPSIPKPTGRRRVVITRHASRSLDRDNLYASVKPVVDVLRPMKVERGVYKTGKKAGQAWENCWIGVGVIIDDSEKWLDLVVRQEVGPGPSFLTIEISDCGGAD